MSHDIEYNPHTSQRLNDNYMIQRDDRKLERFLTEDMPCRQYFKRPYNMRSTRHWGQRKLLICEISFLTQYLNENITTVLYVGASPGNHTPILIEMFPNLQWILYDIRPFSPILYTYKNVQLIHDFFNTLDAEFFKGRNDLLFISDIRNELPKDENVIDEIITDDMNMQQRWFRIINPVAACLKFRLPWNDKKTEYLDGSIQLPVWGPVCTTECRLIVEKDAKTRIYDNKKYENQMFYFNTVTRVNMYRHGNHLDYDPCYDHCYDCVSDAFEIDKYCNKFNHMTKEEVYKTIQKFLCPFTHVQESNKRRRL
eukprot:767551-Hanusia_phi.AAC.3